MLTQERLRAVLAERFGGVLLAGRHKAGDGAACALELHAVAVDIDFTDDPMANGMWDVRPLNDIEVDNGVRAELMLPILVAYSGARGWPLERQQAVAARLAVLTVNRLVAELPGLDEPTRVKSRGDKNLVEAEAAARAASAANAAKAEALAAWAADAATSAAWAAADAARAADAAAWADAEEAAAAAADAEEAAAARTAAGARERVFRTACALWLEAAQGSKRRFTHKKDSL